MRKREIERRVREGGEDHGGGLGVLHWDGGAPWSGQQGKRRRRIEEEEARGWDGEQIWQRRREWLRVRGKLGSSSSEKRKKKEEERGGGGGAGVLARAAFGLIGEGPTATLVGGFQQDSSSRRSSSKRGRESEGRRRIERGEMRRRRGWWWPDLGGSPATGLGQRGGGCCGRRDRERE